MKMIFMPVIETMVSKGGYWVPKRMLFYNQIDGSLFNALFFS